METPAPATGPLAADGLDLPWEVLVNTASYLLETGQYASFGSLLRSCKKAKEEMKMLAKRFEVVEGARIESLEKLAEEPDIDQVE
jgi:hypothetical protein